MVFTDNFRTAQMNTAASMDETSPASHLSAPLVVVAEADTFIGSHIVYLLLHKGYRVKAMGRKLTPNSTRAAALQKIHSRAEECLSFSQVDMKQHNVEAWTKSLHGATHAIIVAVPQSTEIDSRRIAGVLNFLEAANSVASVKVAVVTSSMNAVIEGHPKSRYGDDAAAFDEESLGDSTIATRPADKYLLQLERSMESKYLSTTAASTTGGASGDESPAKKFVVVSICVGHVAGPDIAPPTLTVPANTFLTKVMKKRLDQIPSRSLQLVDVRDVADAHVNALEFINPVDGHTYRRCLVSAENGNDSPESHAKMLNGIFQPYGFSTSAKVQSGWTFNIFGGASPKEPLRNIVINSEKTNSDLLLSPRPVNRILLDFVLFLIKSGAIPANRIPSETVQSFMPYTAVPIDLPAVSITSAHSSSRVKAAASSSSLEGTDKGEKSLTDHNSLSSTLNSSTLAGNGGPISDTADASASPTAAVGAVAAGAGVTAAEKQETSKKDSKQKADAEKQKAAALKKADAEKQKAEKEAAALKKAEEAKQKAEQAAALKKAEEEKQKAEKDAAALKKAEETKQKAEQEAAALKKAEEAKQKAEQEAAALKKAEEEKQKAEKDAAALKKAEEEKQKAEQAAALKKAEEEKQKAEKEAAALKKAEEEKQKAEQEAAALKKAEEEKQKAEAAALKKAEEEKQNAEKEAAALKKAEEEKQNAEQAAALKKAEEEKQKAEKEAAALKKAEEEKQKSEKEAAALKKAEEEKQKAAALKKAEEEKQKAEKEAAALKKAEEEKQKAEQEAAALKKAEEEKQKAEKEAYALKKAEEEKQKAEQEASALKKAEEEKQKAEKDAALKKAEEVKQKAAALKKSEEEKQKVEQETAETKGEENEETAAKKTVKTQSSTKPERSDSTKAAAAPGSPTTTTKARTTKKSAGVSPGGSGEAPKSSPLTRKNTKPNRASSKKDIGASVAQTSSAAEPLND